MTTAPHSACITAVMTLFSSSSLATRNRKRRLAGSTAYPTANVSDPLMRSESISSTSPTPWPLAFGHMRSSHSRASVTSNTPINPPEFEQSVVLGRKHGRDNATVMATATLKPTSRLDRHYSHPDQSTARNHILAPCHPKSAVLLLQRKHSPIFLAAMLILFTALCNVSFHEHSIARAQAQNSTTLPASMKIQPQPRTMSRRRLMKRFTMGRTTDHTPDRHSRQLQLTASWLDPPEHHDDVSNTVHRVERLPATLFRAGPWRQNHGVGSTETPTTTSSPTTDPYKEASSLLPIDGTGQSGIIGDSSQIFLPSTGASFGSPDDDDAPERGRTIGDATRVIVPPSTGTASRHSSNGETSSLLSSYVWEKERTGRQKKKGSSKKAGVTSSPSAVLTTTSTPTHSPKTSKTKDADTTTGKGMKGRGGTFPFNTATPTIASMANSEPTSFPTTTPYPTPSPKGGKQSSKSNKKKGMRKRGEGFPFNTATPTSASSFGTSFPTTTSFPTATASGSGKGGSKFSSKSGKGSGKGGGISKVPVTSAPSTADTAMPTITGHPTSFSSASSKKGSKSSSGKGGMGGGKGRAGHPTRAPRPVVTLPPVVRPPSVVPTGAPALAPPSTPVATGRPVAGITSRPVAVATSRPVVPAATPRPVAGTTLRPVAVTTPAPVAGTTPRPVPIVVTPAPVPIVFTPRPSLAPAVTTTIVPASPFAVTFVGASTSPAATDVATTTTLTCAYLLDYFTLFYSASFGIEFTGLSTCTSTGSAANQVSYQLAVGFGANTDPDIVPTPAQIDILLQVAFLSPSVDALLATLAATPGPFQSTTATQYVVL